LKVEQYVESRMAASHDEHALARVTAASSAEDIGDAVGDALAGGAFTERRHATRAKWIGRAPRARGVDDGARKNLVFAALGTANAEHEWCFRAIGILHLVVRPAADREHLGVQPERRRDRRMRCEWLEVLLHHLAA
jgi:hypothetical protein